MNSREPELRLFVALWPPPAVVEALVAAQRALAARAPRGLLRATPAHQIHLTLSFLGAVPALQLEPLQYALGCVAAKASPLRLHLAGLGAFPNPHQPRLLWAGLAGDLAPLLSLQQRVASAVQPLVPTLDANRFHPHLTLARLREAGSADRRRVSAALHETAPPEPVPWFAASLALVGSVLSPEGSQYSRQAEWPLGPSTLGEPPSA